MTFSPARRKKPTRSYLLLIATLIAMMSLPGGTTETLRSTTIACLSPFWQVLTSAKVFLRSPLAQKVHSSCPQGGAKKISLAEKIQQLELENQQLREQLSHLTAVVAHEEELIQQAGALSSENPSSLERRLSRRSEQLTSLLSMRLDSVPARVIFRSPGPWNSSFWINVGERHNEKVGNAVVAPNSPVVVGTSVVGVIEHVGRRQSRVRLITDSGLTPSVRAERDGWSLAKGELSGSGDPLWRSRSQVLRGVGFNYDFADEEGPARDLRSGEPLDTSEKLPAMPLLQMDDLLVTTGMDGVFPAGLSVAKVTKINMLREGGYFYELEARPTAGNLDDLSLVWVLPPLQ